MRETEEQKRERETKEELNKEDKKADSSGRKRAGGG